MSNLIKKNFVLNKMNFLFGLLGALIFGSISLDGHRYYTVALMMCPSILFTFTVGKMCYTEDTIASRQFLLALPISKKDIVHEKNFWSYFTILLGLAIAILSSLVVDFFLDRDFYYDINTTVVMAIFLIIYNTIFIILNYRYDYSKTQLTPYILLVFMFVFFKFGSEIITFVSSSNLIVMMVIAVLIIVANYALLSKVAMCEQG
ncbi:ABC-2 transporter permease [Fusibacter bizertensis]